MAKGSKTQQRLTELEKELKRRGVRLGYERLEYAGLRLRSGLCWFRGVYYLFVDRLKTLPERIDLIQGALDELDQLAASGRLDQPDAPLAEAGAEAVSGESETSPRPAPLAEPDSATAAGETPAETAPEPNPGSEPSAPAAPEASHEPR